MTSGVNSNADARATEPPKHTQRESRFDHDRCPSAATAYSPSSAAASLAQAAHAARDTDSGGTSALNFASATYDAACRLFAGRSGPLRSIIADEAQRSKVPRSDMMIDVQGPTRRPRGVSNTSCPTSARRFRCRRLPRPSLCRLNCFVGPSCRALCRRKPSPKIVRSDQGANMTSRVSQELLAFCGVKHVQGSAYTPRHQGPVERSQQVQPANHLMSLNSVCAAFPQEWPSLLPVLSISATRRRERPQG